MCDATHASHSTVITCRLSCTQNIKHRPSNHQHVTRGHINKELSKCAKQRMRTVIRGGGREERAWRANRYNCCCSAMAVALRQHGDLAQELVSHTQQLQTSQGIGNREHRDTITVTFIRPHRKGKNCSSQNLIARKHTNTYIHTYIRCMYVVSAVFLLMYVVCAVFLLLDCN